MRFSFFWKLFLSHLTVVLVTALCVGWFFMRQTDERAGAETRQFLQSKLGLLEALARPALGDPSKAPALRDAVRGLGRGIRETRFTVIDAEGTVLADSDHAPETMENHLTRPEVVEAKRRGAGAATRYSTTVEVHTIYVSRRVDGPAQPLGYVRVSLPVPDMERERGQMRRSIFLSGLVAIVLGFFFCLFLARRLARPLREFTQAAMAIAKGDFDQHVAADAHDQVGDLARAFDTMAARLRERIETITRERRELRAILAGMVEGVVAVDRTSHIVLMNAAAGDILGADADVVPGQPLWEAIPLRPVAEWIESALADSGAPEVSEGEIHLLSASGERVLMLHGAPLPTETVQPGGIVVVVHEVTELRRLERVRRDFVSNASHELKTPVAAIRGLVETILEDPEMDPATRNSFLDRARRQTARLTQLIDEMLALSRLEERTSGGARHREDLAAAVRDSIETAQPAARERGVRIMSALPETPVFVQATRENLLRTVGNLLDNAVKYTGEGTPVHVRLAAHEGTAMLEIEDHGPGIPAADRERIFERFYRVDRGRSRDVGGTGLGLAIVKHVVSMLGGTVEVEAGTTPTDAGNGSGSLFRVRLPTA